MRFVVGDACTLDEPDDSFDVVRSERTLQWLADPEAAVSEMTRVLRPGGLVSLVDTDWGGRDPDDLARAIAAEIPLLPGINHYFASATVTRSPRHPIGRLIGDGLVLRASAARASAPAGEKSGSSRAEPGTPR